MQFEGLSHMFHIVCAAHIPLAVRVNEGQLPMEFVHLLHVFALSDTSLREYSAHGDAYQ